MHNNCIDSLLFLGDLNKIIDKRYYDLIDKAEYLVYYVNGENHQYNIDDIMGFCYDPPKVGDIFENPYDPYTHIKIVLVDYVSKEIYARVDPN